jgi:hypothetical protein
MRRTRKFEKNSFFLLGIKHITLRLIEALDGSKSFTMGYIDQGFWEGTRHPPHPTDLSIEIGTCSPS